MFETSVTSVEDAEHSGCQSTSKTGENVDQVKYFVLKIRIMNICKLLMLETSFGSVLSILKDSLNMRRIAAKFVPHRIVLSQSARCNKCAINQRNCPILYMYSCPSLKAHKYSP